MEPIDRETKAPSNDDKGLFILTRFTETTHAYDPDTCDLDHKIPGTPEPEPYDPETYATWGRRHFGEEWFQQRKTMLQERNIYHPPDEVYRERQVALRILEHTIENRPSRPCIRRGGKYGDGQNRLEDEGWQKIWARIAQTLPPELREDTSSPPSSTSGSPVPSDASIATGYDTYPPTPEPRATPPESRDPLEGLELGRKLFGWHEKEYQFFKFFLLEDRIDKRRAKREDEEGDDRYQAELDEISKVLKPLSDDPVERVQQHNRYYELMRDLDLRTQGWTEDQIEKNAKSVPLMWDIWEKHPALRKYATFPFQPKSQEKMDEMFRVWDAAGVDPAAQDELSRLWDFGGKPAPEPTGPGRDEDKDDEETRRQTVGQTPGGSSHLSDGRVTKVTARNSSPQKTPQSGRATHAQKSRPSKRQPPKRGPDSPGSGVIKSRNAVARAARQPSGRQHKTDCKQRASRRLAGQPPEFGLLPERGVAVPIATVTNPPNGRQTRKQQA